MALAYAALSGALQAKGDQGATSASHFVLTAPIRDALAARPALAGPHLQPSQLRGRVVFVTFFASWCAPCRKEMAELQQLHARYGEQGLRVVAVNYFETFDGLSNPARLQAFLQRITPSYSVVAGDPGLAETFGGVHRIPTLLVFDRAGRRVRHFFNSGPDSATMSLQALESLATQLL